MPCRCLSVTIGFIWGNQICKRLVVVFFLFTYICSSVFFFWGPFMSPSSSTLCRWLSDVLSCKWHRGGAGRGKYSADPSPQTSCILHMWNVKLPVSVSLRLRAGVSCIRRRGVRVKGRSYCNSQHMPGYSCYTITFFTSAFIKNGSLRNCLGRGCSLKKKKNPTLYLSPQLKLNELTF